MQKGACGEGPEGGPERVYGVSWVEHPHKTPTNVQQLLIVVLLFGRALACLE